MKLSLIVSSANLNGKGHESRMMHGVKISKDNISGEIKIFNPRGKDYDEELTPQEYLTFQEGWRIGVIQVSFTSISQPIRFN